MSHDELIALLDRFAEAWNRHDLDALMSMMTDDCVFQASAGPDADGERSEGPQAVRAAYASVFDDISRRALGQRPAFRHRHARGVGMDVYRHAERRSVHRGHRLRPFHVSRREDRGEELIPQESAGDVTADGSAVAHRPSSRLHAKMMGCNSPSVRPHRPEA